jgi:outer membrane protein
MPRTKQRKEYRLLYFLQVSLIGLIGGMPQICHSGLLLDLYQQALATNPGLLGRGYAIDQASAQEDQAFSRLLPQISANGSFSYNRFNSRGAAGTQYYDGLRGTVQASQSLFNLSSYLRYQGAQAATLQAQLEQDAYRMQLAGNLLDQYLQVLEATDRIGDVQAEQKAVASQVQRLKQMQQRQMAKITDVYEVEAYDQTLITLEIEAENEKAVGLERLRETTSVSLDTVDSLNDTQLPAVPENLQQWLEKAVKNNPGLSALQYAIESATKQIASAKAEHLPQLALQLAETYSDQGYDNRQLPAYDVASVNLQLIVPIYEGGRVDAATREAVARQQMAKQQYILVRRQIEREIRTAFMNAKASKARIKSTGQEVYAQNKAYKAQQKGYRLGVATIVDVLNSRRRLFRARTEQLQSRYDYIRSLIALRIWSGGLTVATIEEMDGWFTAKSSVKDR